MTATTDDAAVEIDGRQWLVRSLERATSPEGVETTTIVLLGNHDPRRPGVYERKTVVLRAKWHEPA